MGRKLDPRERRFVEEYLLDLDPKRAAFASGYSATMAASKAYQWVSNSKLKPHVYAAIQEAMQERSERTKVTADEVLLELRRIGFSDAWNYQVANGRLVLTKDAPEDATRAVASVKHKTRTIPVKDGEPIIEHTVEFRLWDKNTALANIGKHLGMFIDRHEVTGKDGEPLYKAYVGFDPTKV